MYVIVVYDCKEGRTRIPRKFLRQYLLHVQNSVFEGSITEGQYKEIEKRLSEHHNSEESIIIYKIYNENNCKRTVMGDDPTEEHNFLG